MVVEEVLVLTGVVLAGADRRTTGDEAPRDGVVIAAGTVVVGEVVTGPEPVVGVVPMNGPVVQGRREVRGCVDGWLGSSDPDGHRAAVQIAATASTPPPIWSLCRRSLARARAAI